MEDRAKPWMISPGRKMLIAFDSGQKQMHHHREAALGEC
jgi:hypothetical protein